MRALYAYRKGRSFMLQKNKRIFHKYITSALSFLCAGTLFLSYGFNSYAETKEERLAAHRAMAVESNQIENWPEGPVVNAKAAILMEINTGTILYSKNIYEAEYPASTTKILTALIASEESSLDEVVSFSHDAVFGIPYGSNHIAMNEGDTLTMEQCLDAILIRSANEVSYAVAEHIGGTWEGFADMMNKRATELGCVNSNFVNPNGLPDENHYTCAYDLAMIGRAFFANEMLCKITTTDKLVIPKGEETLIDWNQMKLLPRYEYAYEYLVGCKTGYTDSARSTLVSCAEKDGLKLICVVLKDEAPYQYEDTIALFNYGFSNFEEVNISQTETKYNIADSTTFYSDNDIFGNSQPILSLNKKDCIILPKTADFADTVSSISYETTDANQAALITYTYQDVYIGSASVDFVTAKEENYIFDIVSPNDLQGSTPAEPKTDFIFINVIKVLAWTTGILVVLLLIFLGRALLKNYHFSRRNNRRTWRRNRRKQNIPLSFRRNRKRGRKSRKNRDYDF